MAYLNNSTTLGVSQQTFVHTDNDHIVTAGLIMDLLHKIEL